MLNGLGRIDERKPLTVAKRFDTIVHMESAWRRRIQENRQREQELGAAIFQHVQFISQLTTRRRMRTGELPSLKKEFVLCVKCGTARAAEYDHRDYLQPRDVQPFCRSCNKQAGSARVGAKQVIRLMGYWWRRV